MIRETRNDTGRNVLLITVQLILSSELAEQKANTQLEVNVNMQN